MTVDSKNFNALQTAVHNSQVCFLCLTLNLKLTSQLLLIVVVVGNVAGVILAVLRLLLLVVVAVTVAVIVEFKQHAIKS